jgi:WD40 repeat protein
VFVADVERGRLLGSALRAHWPSSVSSSSPGGDDCDEDPLAHDEELIRLLYGDYDGGGVLAVAMTRGAGTDDIIASAGREGGIKLHRWVRGLRSSSRMAGEGIDELEFVGSVHVGGDVDGDHDAVVTCLRFDSLGRRLYAGGADGRLTILTFENTVDIVEGILKTRIPSLLSSSSHSRRSERGQSPTQSLTLSPILSLDVSEALDMLATANANGDVRVYSLDVDDERYTRDDGDALPLLGVWNPFADTNDACHARSVAFVSCGSEQQGVDDDDENDDDPSWSIVAGGGNGRLWVQEIHPSYYAHGTITASPTSAVKKTKKWNDDEKGRTITSTTATMPSLFRENSMQQIKPSHRGPVLSMASRPGGILISAGHDGMLRVSCISKPVPKALYGLGGYKVWIGSICIDDEGKRLLSDGRDDVVVVHDFSKDD